MSHRDMVQVLDDMKIVYPELIFFAPAHFYDIPGKADPARQGQSGDKRSKDLTTFHADAASCFAALREEQITFQRAPAIRMAMRVPWPEEMVSGDLMRMRGGDRSGHVAFYDDDPALWHEKGRLVDMTIPAIEPQTILSLDASGNRWLRQSTSATSHRPYSPEDFGAAREIDSLSQFAEIFTWYNIDDPETAAFMATLRRLFNRQKTTRVAWYDPATGRYLDRHRGPHKQYIGRDLLAWLCHHPGVYDYINFLGENYPGLERRLAGQGPAPDFKAEVYLEAGLPIDDIDGLTSEERDRLLRRHEKKMEAR